MGSRYIYIGGKVFVDHEVTLRGDLHRLPEESLSASSATDKNASIVPIINLGRYCLLNAKCTLTPPQRFSKSANKMMRYPIKIGSFVSIGKNTSVEAASIGNYVHIGDNCQIGKFAVIKDCVKVRSNTTVPPYAVVDSYSLLSGVPSKKVGELPECMDEVLELAIRELYLGIDVDEENLLEPCIL
ncbi:trimeric LpxA-like protein [Nadsonia fulvescens var. elongata DSM 6958]|uniref:Dynactin subunit 5 n=1 Tax=Nadsonia fulvescens var. elongata DSM 6958 TaxID=857566 RepID=A0A1E3PIF7_9ASCO|nr:trimeric LpxA-like protein [Nadsonia fulvescens var. elongata DSM 6958]